MKEIEVYEFEGKKRKWTSWNKISRIHYHESRKMKRLLSQTTLNIEEKISCLNTNVNMIQRKWSSGSIHRENEYNTGKKRQVQKYKEICKKKTKSPFAFVKH